MNIIILIVVIAMILGIGLIARENDRPMKQRGWVTWIGILLLGAGFGTMIFVLLFQR